MLIDENYIFKDLHVKSYKDLFEKIGKKLINDNIVKEGFIEELINREENFPTGLPVKYGVAIPHTEGSFVKEDKLVFTTLKKPITFYVMGGSPDETVNVRLVIFLVIGDGKKHLSILQNIINSIQREDFVSGIIFSENKNEMLTVINNFL